MNQFNLDELSTVPDPWKIIATTAKTQMAMMSLEEGKVSGEYGTTHPDSDQILICLKGSGTAVVEGREIPFKANDVLLIVAGEKHQIKGGPCTTLNVYGPPAYN